MNLFLLLEAVVWLPYGLLLVFAPNFLVTATESGLVANTPTGMTEIRAMYGGAQAAIGTFCLVARFRHAYAHPALLMLAFLTSGLALARLYQQLLAAPAGGPG